MAYHRKHHYHHRHNPFGISVGTMKDAVYVAVGAVGAGALPGMVAPHQSKGWAGVLATGIAAVAVSFGARMIGGATAAAEALKGGLAATVIRAVHEAGFAKGLGLGLYAPSWFGIPTASSQYLQTAAPGSQFHRGYGTVFFPGPGQASLPPAQLAAAQTMGYHRFRSRYWGGYG